MGGERDSGLLRAVGPWGLAANIVTNTVGAGIFALPAALAAALGSYAVFAVLGCALVVGAVAVCFAEGGSRVATSGGVYGCIEAGLGPFAGYTAGVVLAVSDVLACGGVSASLADIVGSLVPPPQREPVRLAVIIGVVGVVVLVNLGGVARGAWLVTALTALKLLPLAVFVAAGLPGVQGSHFAAPGGGAGLGHAVLLSLFAFVGMEGALSVSGEVADPARNIPRALALALGLVTVLYVAIQLISQGILGPALAVSPAPLADAAGRIHPALRILMLAGGALSMLGWLAGDLLASPRILFAVARGGRLPRVLGRVHPRSRVPHVAILCYGLTAIALAISGTFAELAVLSALASCIIYIGGCLAAGRLARAGVARSGRPLGFPALRAAMAVGITGMLFMIALASRAEILGLAALLALCAAGYRLQARWAPAVGGS